MLSKLDYSPSVNYQSYLNCNNDGDCSTGQMRHRQSVEDLIQETKQHVKSTHDRFFGLYSKEKSDLMKYERSESIKRAEQMLQELIRDKSTDSKRPSYLGTSRHID